MEELIEAYVRYLTAERNLSSYTLRNYRSDLRDFGRYLEAEEIGALKVGRQSFRRYLAHLHEAGTAAASVGRKVSTIHAFYRFLVRQGILERDPLMGVSIPSGRSDCQRSSGKSSSRRSSRRRTRTAPRAFATAPSWSCCTPPGCGSPRPWRWTWAAST